MPKDRKHVRTPTDMKPLVCMRASGNVHAQVCMRVCIRTRMGVCMRVRREHAHVNAGGCLCS